jgi:hypothetical protein
VYRCGTTVGRRPLGNTPVTKGQVTMRGPGLDRIVVDVHLEENTFETVFEEQDLSTTVNKDR